MQPSSNESSDYSPMASPMEPPTGQLTLNVTSNTAVHKEYYHFVFEAPTPINLYVQLLDMPGESLVDMEEDGNNVWVSLEWGIVDWFFNWDKDWDAGGMITREEAIKNIALAYWYDK